MHSSLLIGAVALTLTACGNEAADPVQYGPNPNLPEAERGLLPSMKIARPANWGNELPTVPQGYTVQAIATDLQVPRQTLVLPNGDILIAEGSGGGAPALRPKDIIANFIKALGKTSVKGGNRLTLLRDADGDGTYEARGIFADKLNAPYGLALINGAIYVANQDSVVRFDYRDGQTEASGPPTKVTDLPSAINHHWTKAMTASPDGRFLYVGIGSNSNITERGTDQLWAVVNERDEIGPNLVPDYLTSVREGEFYGWPYSYWGNNADPRAQPQNPEKVAAAITPDYSLGSHVAALGLAFSAPAMGANFTEGAFVGEHGSWNRNPPVGYKVIFVPFRDGKPAGDPIDFVTGFLQDDGNTRGRPVGVTVDQRGALIVADDLSNTVWRVTANQAQPASATGAGGTQPPQVR
jgi:glucose/arabinose dehydrogenase